MKQVKQNFFDINQLVDYEDIPVLYIAYVGSIYVDGLASSHNLIFSYTNDYTEISRLQAKLYTRYIPLRVYRTNNNRYLFYKKLELINNELGCNVKGKLCEIVIANNNVKDFNKLITIIEADLNI